MPLSNYPPRILRHLFLLLPSGSRQPNPLIFHVEVLFLTLLSLSAGRVRRNVPKDERHFQRKKSESLHLAQNTDLVQPRPMKIYFRKAKPKKRNLEKSEIGSRKKVWMSLIPFNTILPTRHWTLRIGDWCYELSRTDETGSHTDQNKIFLRIRTAHDYLNDPLTADAKELDAGWTTVSKAAIDMEGQKIYTSRKFGDKYTALIQNCQVLVLDLWLRVLSLEYKKAF
ncbi:hypothetical protein EV356DRAFT_213265 [Viridothelium virens]|uniref:Uncharacterized protein n=1 Tax=Viridothelium virens TaxID=1048519 RepID=A0A6A6H5K5_VIRVR|nr:hypothetical protein EV356DRAFT_213265 [Viridothelium virens]